MNNSDPPTSVGEDQCVDAQNVEFYESTLGERRLGCTDVELPASITGNANIQAITWAKRHLPTADETAAELWIMGQHLTDQHVVMTRKTTSWTGVSSIDGIDVTAGKGFTLSAATLHGKLFIAFRSLLGIDRLHVVDAGSTTLRRTGLAESAAPTAADTGTPGVAYTGVRYFRVRYVVLDGTTVLRRSEPSETLTFTPSGSGTAARITKPASISESETHWEVEASVSSATGDFYRIARVVVGTTTYDDSTVYASGYASATDAVLSEDVGDYRNIHSGEFLAVDEDRLVIGGSHEDTELASRVSWTPRYNDPGDGNDERIPLDTTNYLDLDGFEGGPLTYLSNPVNGSMWATKRSHTYKLVRTGQRDRAYEAFNISKTLGALRGSVVEGVDQYGMPCLYALDPEVGPWRTGGNRVIQSCSRDILTTWETVNVDATIVSRAYYYPEKMQVHWVLSSNDASFPDKHVVLQTNNTREGDDGIRGGWSIWTGKIARAYAACLYAENIDDDDARSLILRPFIGVTAADGYLLRCDTANTDDGTAYVASLITRPYILRNILSKFQVMAAALIAKAHATASVVVNIIRDFGLEENTATVTLAPVGSEDQVVKQLPRTFGMSGAYAVQLEFTDAASPDGQWQINRCDLKVKGQESA